MRLIRTSLIAIFLSSILLPAIHAAVTGSNEVSCSIYGGDAASCNQCFDGGTDYVGDTTAVAFDDIFQSTSGDYLLLPQSSGLSAGPVTLQSSVSVGVSSDYGVTFPASVIWDIGPSGLGNVFTISPFSRHAIAHMNGGVLFTAVSAGANPNRPALRYEYITNAYRYDIPTDTANGPAITHKECAFISPRFCGDNIVSNGEVCDEGGLNGQAGHCNVACTSVTPLVSSCDSMTATPISGAAPLDVTVTCNATNATAYHIDCGNGTTNLASTAVCRYVAGGTFTPRCTINGSITSPACAPTVTIAPPPATPACSTVVTGTQTFPITTVTPGLCNVGSLTPASFNANTVGIRTNYTWTCTNGAMNSPVCSANYTPPQPGAPDLALKKFINGNDAQLVSSAIDITNNTAFTYTINITNVGSGTLLNSTTTVLDPLPAGITLTSTPTGAGWTCTGASGSTTFTCSRTEALATGALFPTITVPVQVSSSSTFLTNTAELSNPLDVLTANNTDPAVIHILPSLLPACIPGPTTGPQAVALTATSVGLCLGGVGAVGGFTGVTNGTITTYNWSCGGSAVGGACAATFNSAVVNATDLSIRKFVNGSDAQNAIAAVNVATGTALTYTLFVRNEGLITATGTTTVTDTLPVGVTLVSVPNIAPWTCTPNLINNSFTCTTAATIAFNITLPTITVNATTTTSTGNFTNIGTVANPNDVNIANNTDPAVILAGGGSSVVACVPGPTIGTQTIPLTATSAGLCPGGAAVVGGFTGTTVGTVTTYTWSCGGSAVGGACAATFTTGGGGGGTSNIGKKCINGVASCASYNSLIACTNDGIPAALCYSSDAVGIAACQAQSMVCSGPGGGGCSGASCYVGGSCGDGVLGSSAGEECDVVGAPWCVACKIRGLTNPGANPITDLWMTIPVLAGTQRIGYSWLDGIPGQVAFSDNQMVLGVGTKAFTLADTVGFGIKTRYRIPLILESTKKICIKSEGSSMNSEAICTSFADAASISSGIEQWQRADGTWFVNIGAGDYQKINPSPRPPMPVVGDPQYAIKIQAYNDWRQYIPMTSYSANNITLFKGSTQYTRLGELNLGPTLNSAFFARTPGIDGVISILACTGTDCSASAVTDIVSLSVHVSGAAVSSIGSPVNRSLQAFINPGNPFAGFMIGTSGDTSTTTNNAVTTIAPVVLPTLVGGAAGTVSSLADLERYAVNGNKNVLAINGDLTVTCPTGRTIFEMEGVRTVIVTGNLIIRCNIVYASNDTVSSWAWITKGGNIQVYNGNGTLSDGAITNMAGVFVSIKEGTIGGDITYIGNTTTQTILRVEGSLYGNASSLFSSRLYARATGAYDILTTGTIINYSNRALVNPPPLLSQYLGNYQVERVIQ